ncbi:hypothetical protein BJX68DRAFT_69211 [Aspergillus pseudodeflectus]|uniref:F-box domain-containing protein n=1 Tax=Aspergillus pseudodeflectus TaxID=176178 RepID=A0ABR4KHW8_9EURO
MSLSPLHRLPAELLVLIFNSLPRIKDAVSLALTCKKTYALFERFEDRARIIYSIVDNIPTSLPKSYPTKSWLEGYFPPNTPFWTPTATQIPKELEHAETLAFLKTTGFPIFECERLDFSSRILEPAEPGNKSEDDAPPVSKRKVDETSQRASSEDGSGEEDSGKEDEDGGEKEDEQWKDPLHLGTWFSQDVVVDSSTGKIQRRSWDDDGDDEDEDEDIADNVGRFLVLLGVIRSVMCDLQICGLQRFRKEQIERDEEVEEVVLEKLFEGLGAVNKLVKEAAFWGWICNYLCT